MTHRDPATKAAYMRQYRQRNAERIKTIGIEYRTGLRDEARNHYGESCVQCGFSDPLALVLDHINDNGAEERMAAGGKHFAGYNFYRLLKKQGWPAGYQTLCANCNMIKEQKRLIAARMLV